MQVYIIRHAIAMDRGDWKGDDSLRPLTEEGIERMRAAAAGLRAFGVRVDALVSSPLVRAQQTAKILQEALGGPEIATNPLLRPEAKPEAVLPFLDRFPNKTSVALVGHEPHVGRLLGFLLTGHCSPITSFKKGAVACLDMNRPLTAGSAELRWFAPPRLLIALAAPAAGRDVVEVAPAS